MTEVQVLRSLVGLIARLNDGQSEVTDNIIIAMAKLGYDEKSIKMVIGYPISTVEDLLKELAPVGHRKIPVEFAPELNPVDAAGEKSKR
jgi:hypothetical protein